MKKYPPGFYVYVLMHPLRSGLFEYGIWNCKLQPFYVGKGSGHRKQAHFSPSNSGRVASRIRNITNECGRSAVIEIVKSGLSEQQAFELETLLISAIGRIDLRKGPLMNLTVGGEGSSGAVRSEEALRMFSEKMTGHSVSPETRAKISAALIGHQNNLGWHHSEETKAKWRKPKSPEVRARMTIARRLRREHMTDEVKEKISDSLRGRPLSEETKSKMRGRVPWNKGLCLK